MEQPLPPIQPTPITPPNTPDSIYHIDLSEPALPEPTHPLELTEGADIIHGAGPGPSAISSIGTLSLALIFTASTVFTVSYLQTNADTASKKDVGNQVAAAAVPVQIAPAAFASTTLQASAAYVLDVTDNHILYSLNPDAQLPLASITKVPMALVVSEVLTPEMRLVIPRDTGYPASPDRLITGDTWRIGDVIDLTLAASSNDGAEILAEAANESLRAKYPLAPIGGATSATLWRMNDLAKQLGLSKTYFLNVSGLDESTTQSGAYGSARDVATLFAYAASTSPRLFAGTTQSSFSLMSLNGATATAINTDKALNAIPGIIMGKTGYTDLAGGNLAIVFEPVPGHRVIAVVLGSTETGRFEDMKKLVAATQDTIK
ncbi:D-alanyl-D-alanine carboxypeptidase [Candidatus Kaiserbacteria bacterium]|nr:D-alanyl-D-alanine carboxypeptidase [Candidatus Kaiserbacteria bacterium]